VLDRHGGHDAGLLSVRAATLALLALLVSTGAAVAQPSTTPAPTPARAVSAADRAAAEDAFRVGAQAFRANLFAVAADSFEQAHARDPRPETAFSLGQANRLAYFGDRAAWRVQRAVQMYQWYLSQLPSGPRARDASDHLGVLEPLLAELRRRGELVPFQPVVRTQLVVGAEVEKAEVTIDGAKVGLWQPTEVAPGPHQIVVDAPGYEVATRRVVIAAGAFVPVDVPLVAKPGRLRVRAEAGARLYIDGRAAGAVGGAPRRITPGEHFVSVTRRGRTSWSGVVEIARDQELALDVELAPTGQRRVAHWVLGSAAALAVTAGGVELWAWSARRDAEEIDQARRDLTATPADLARYNRLVDDAQTRRAVAIGLGAGALAIGALGAGMWLFDHEPPGTTSRLELTPVIGKDGSGAMLRGAF
jgi:hypothetical protein